MFRSKSLAQLAGQSYRQLLGLAYNQSCPIGTNLSTAEEDSMPTTERRTAGRVATIALDGYTTAHSALASLFSSQTINADHFARCNPIMFFAKISPKQAFPMSEQVRTLQTMMVGEAQAYYKSTSSFDDMFASTFNQIVTDLQTDQAQVPMLEEVQSWLKKAVEYNLPHGKRNRAKSLVLAFEHLTPFQLNDEQIRLACILGWCVELLQAYFLVSDDIMDESITRRGQLCWYRKENVGLTAFNDAIMFNNSIFFLLKHYFASHSAYLKIVDLFNEVTRFTAYGQCLDVISNPLKERPNLSTYTDDRYNTIVQYKTSYYSFCLPIRLAMYLCNITDSQTHANAEKILLKIGHLFQVQDDYLDCYGDSEVTGKIGTDIEDGKCCWLVVTALKIANAQQRQTIELHYGLKSQDSVARIKEVYQELHIAQIFKEYEQREFNEICCLIERVGDETLPKDVFYNFLAMIYRREK